MWLCNRDQSKVFKVIFLLVLCKISFIIIIDNVTKVYLTLQHSLSQLGAKWRGVVINLNRYSCNISFMFDFHHTGIYRCIWFTVTNMQFYQNPSGWSRTVPSWQNGRMGTTSLKVNFRSPFSNLPKHLHRIYNKYVTIISDACLKQNFFTNNV
jgi:hypothetical protein